MKDKKELKDFINFNTLSIFNKLVKNALWILFVFDLIIFLFYIFGNYFNYTDKTLILILRIMSGTSVMLGIISVVGFFENIVYIFFDKRLFRRIISIIFAIITLAVAVLLIVYSTVLMHLALGLN
ncbi:MAG: hypothetical protein J5527_06905 [Treponema sp.]|nr:hypothetical protein [Treponema sp.]